MNFNEKDKSSILLEVNMYSLHWNGFLIHQNHKTGRKSDKYAHINLTKDPPKQEM